MFTDDMNTKVKREKVKEEKNKYRFGDSADVAYIINYKKMRSPYRIRANGLSEKHYAFFGGCSDHVWPWGVASSFKGISLR